MTATDTQSPSAPTPKETPRLEVSRADLPLHCPLPGASGWDSHPRVYLPIKEQGGQATCPYCGADYVLKD